jgi:hypothetical protein
VPVLAALDAAVLLFEGPPELLLEGPPVVTPVRSPEKVCE